jgi:hypothetical protein
VDECSRGMTKLEVRDVVSLFNPILYCTGDVANLASFQGQNHAIIEFLNPCTFLLSSIAFCLASASVNFVCIPGILSALITPC